MGLPGWVALTLWAATSVGCELVSGPGPATFRITVPGEGPANVEPVARLVPGTRSYNPWSGGFWAVGPVNEDGTVRVDSQLPLVFRETELGLEIVSQTRTASSTFEGAAVIETITPSAAEVVVPRELRDGMTWRTGPDEQYEWSARVQDDVATPIGPRRVWTITASQDRREGTLAIFETFGVIEGVGVVSARFDPRFDVLVAPAEAPPTVPAVPTLALRPLALDAEASEAALWFDPSALQANAFEDGSLVLQIAGRARGGRDVLDGERSGDCFVVLGSTVSVADVEVRPFEDDSRLERGSQRTCRFQARDLTGGSPGMGTRLSYGLATDASGTQYISSGEAWFVPRDGRGVEDSTAYAWLSATGSASAVSFPSGYPTPNARMFSWTAEVGVLAGTTWLAPAQQSSGGVPVPLWWLDARGNVIRAEASDSDRIGPAQNVAFSPGRPSVVAFEGGHELLTTSADGLVTRFVATPGSERFEVLGRVALPPLHTLIGAVRHPSTPSRLVLAVADRSRRLATDFAGGARLIRATGSLRLFEADVSSSPSDASPPPGLALSAVPRGADLIVCGPARAGALAITEGWTLGARAARVEPGPGSCVWVLRALETTADELAQPDAWHVHGVLPGVGEFDLGLSTERVESTSHQLLAPDGTSIAGGFMSDLAASSIEGIPLTEPRLDVAGTVTLMPDERGVVWGVPLAEEGFILRADLEGVERFTIEGAAPRILGPVMGGGFAVRLVPGVAEEARIVGDDGVLGPVIDRAARAGAFYWPDGFKCQVTGDRVACFAADATTSDLVLVAGEPLPALARSWGPTRALLFGAGRPTFVLDRAAGTLRKLDDRAFFPAEAPDGAIYGVLQRNDTTQTTEVVRLDETGFAALPVARPAWIPEFVEPSQVSVSADRLAVRFRRDASLPPIMQPLVVYERPR